MQSGVVHGSNLKVSVGKMKKHLWQKIFKQVIYDDSVNSWHALLIKKKILHRTNRTILSRKKYEYDINEICIFDNVF